jgi:glyoxylase-like metal-dependent hydrolase (beta-lactamase superfamily II)
LLAEGVYVLVAEPDSVNLGLVVGMTGAVVVDTGSSRGQGEALRAAVARVTEVPVVAAVVTHAHSDHAFGLGAFADVSTLGHESLRPQLTRAAAENGADLPSREIAVAAALDLGGRWVEVAHLGAGHTEGDLVVVVPDADLIFAGDLIESAGASPESAGAVWYGPDSHPHAWPSTLDNLVGLMTGQTRAVPGHGPPVDRESVFETRGRVAAVAGEIQRLASSGVPAEQALAQGSWPFPSNHVAEGIGPGYAQLARTAGPGGFPLPLV